MSSTPPRATQRDNSSVTTLPPVSDTPSKIKQSVSAPVICSKKLDQGREAVVQDVGSNVPEVPVQWFMDNILPRPLPNFNLPDIIQRLESAGHITSGAWTKFDKLPAQSPKTEDDVFAALEPIARAIGEQAIEQAREQARDQPGSTLLKIPEPTVVFQCRPKSTPRSLRRYSASRPDGYGLYINHPSHGYSTDGRPFWEAIVAPCEFKKKQAIEDINDNIAKILWSFHHIMRDDPTRRFVVGYTIENTDMRLWFGSRTDALVTEPFNFIRDVETLTHFYLALMFAEAHELGYDPTMRPAGDPSRWRNSWDITVHDGSHLDTSQPVDVSKLRTVVFRTGEVESNIGAEAMRSRGTRVWRVRKIKSGGGLDDKDGGLDDKGGGLDDKVMVLKDYWVDHDRLREATIRQRILDDAENDEEKATLEKHLLTPLYSGDVIIAGQRDNTHSLLRRGAEVPVGSLYPTYHEEKPSTVGTIPEDEPYAPQGTGTIGAREDRIEDLMMLNDKSHHRIVFAEVASTVEHVETVQGVFQVAQQATTALKSMHKCGWVHRDISSGNILIVDGVVKIGDLEYAKRMDDDTSHAGRSGTALYMSIEAIKHDYDFLPVDEPYDDEPSLDSDDEPSNEIDAKLAAPKPLTRAPFRYNPLHDLESLWWVLVYLLLNRSTDIQGDTAERFRRQFRFYNTAFTGKFPSRQDMFKMPGRFREGEETLHKKMRRVATLLDWARSVLASRYVKVESGDLWQIDHAVGDRVVSRLNEQFGRVAKKFAGDSDVKLSPLRPPSRRKTTPEEPGAATAIGTSLDFHAEGSRKRRADEVESTVIDYPQFKELQENLKKRKINKTGEVESDGQATEAAEVLQQVVEEEADKTDVKGKGKARELPDDSDSVSESHSSDDDLYQ